MAVVAVDLAWPTSMFAGYDVYEAAARLHDEAHADDKVPFRNCARPTCRDLLFAFDLREMNEGWE